MKTLILALVLVLIAEGADAHSIKSAFCNAQSALGEPRLNILVQADGSIIATGGPRAVPLTAKVKPDGTVDLLLPDGWLMFESATMSNGYFFATYHQRAERGGAVVKATIPCVMR